MGYIGTVVWNVCVHGLVRACYEMYMLSYGECVLSILDACFDVHLIILYFIFFFFFFRHTWKCLEGQS